ncbi:MAG TPA: RDD family protein [Candidatus Limnocylindrales bacterium]|nr:RDD family protein [Candidatus Limnocylindrales bacterium]
MKTAVQLGRLEVETPDHVVLRYDLAGGGNRGFAALVDFVLAALIFAGAFFGFSLLSNGLGSAVTPLFGALVLITFTLAWSYFVLLEWLWQGQTVGKRLYGLRVIRDDGAPAGFVAVLVRNLIRIIDFLPLLYGVGLLTIIVTSRSQRLGDLAAGTYVVRAPRPRLDYFSLRTITPLGTGAAVETRAMPGEMQRLVREFVAREAKLAPKDRARVAKQIADRIRPYALHLDPGIDARSDDTEFIRSVARAMRASGGER